MLGSLRDNIHRNIHELCTVRLLYIFTKNINTRQPAQSAQADMGRYFSIFFNFLPLKGPPSFMTDTLSVV